jgi:Protein of unknown function (DUF2911)
MTPFTKTFARRVRGAAFLLLAAAPAGAHAQIRASEKATVSQTADGTVFTVTYFRPQARGRTALFGKTVKMGEMWTPGANWATVFDMSRDITLDGHAVTKGKYSVWFVVRERDWTIILDPSFERFHEDRPDSSARQIRWTVHPTEAAPLEILTWSIPEVRADGMQIHFAWGTKQLSLNATVQASHPLPITLADAAPYLGRYQWKWSDSAAVDTVVHRLELTHDGTFMRETHTPFPDWYPRVQGQPMVRINADWFITAIVIGGKVWEMDSDMVYEFTLKNGKAVSFEIRDSKDTLLASGTRIGAP